MVLCVLRGPNSPKLSKNHDLFIKNVSRKKCINKLSFQMCQESSLDHFGQGKISKTQKNHIFLRDPGKIRKS